MQQLPAAARDTLVNPLIRMAAAGSLSAGHPSKFTFSKNGEALFFIASGQSYEQSLYYVLVPDGESTQPLAWKRLCNATELMQGARKMTKEEELLRERQRTVAVGITSFIYDKEAHRLLIPVGGSLYVVDGLDLKEGKFNVREVPTTDTVAARMDAKLSSDGRMVSFVRNNDIWLCDLQTGKEHRLTTAGAQDGVMCGVAEFVQQEEFNRYTGYFWQPSSTEYTILYSEVDETGVAKYNIPEPGVEGTVETARYPLAGKANAKVQIKLVRFDTATESATNLALTPSLSEIFPDMEYLVRFGWCPDGKSVWVQTLDRVQQTLRLSVIGVNQFGGAAASVTPATSVINETTSVWINVNDLCHFLKDGRVIWNSERTGFRHLYLLMPNAGGYSSYPITHGDGWQVDEEDITVDEAKQLVYFQGTKETPLESHLYVASYAQANGPIHRLTTPGFDHHVGVGITANGAFFATKYTNVRTPPACALFRVVISDASLTSSPPVIVSLAPLQDLSRTRSIPIPTPPPELFHFTAACGEVLHGAIYLPANFDPNQKYPTVLHVYGGPHVQQVTNNWMFMVAYKLRTYVLNLLGFVVIVADGRGSYRRGLKFEGALRERMGSVELTDQVEVLQHVIKRGIVDPARVAVEGWSYGGYLSLLLLASHPKVFKIAIAGGPVTDWKAYDTAYTERYMNTPQANEAGYKAGSVLSLAAQFPDEENRLVLVHGLIDENVHFCNTAILIDALLDQNKPYHLWLYPSERHGIRSHKNTVHLDTRFVHFLLKHL